jgi:hypothetical protein
MFIESLESRTFLSASPEVIAADRAAIAADRAQIFALVKQKATTFAADHKDLVTALLNKARNAGLLRRDLIRQAITLTTTLLQHRREWNLQIHEKQLEINEDRRNGDTAELENDQADRASLIASKEAQTKQDLQAIRDAFKAVEPQIKAFLADAQPEIDQLKAQLAANKTNFKELIREARQQLHADQLKLHQDLRA